MTYSDKRYTELEKTIRLAGETLMSFWPGGEAQAKLERETKADGSLVTSADFASNEIIVGKLRELFPEDGILSEEIPPTPELEQAERLWIIDPLDGTQSFSDGNSDFSILVGLSVKSKVIFGLMYFPAMGILASSELDGDALIDGAAIRVSEYSEIRPESVYIRKFTPEKSSLIYPERMDSGMALLGLARGDFDGLIIKLNHHKQWDLAAPSVLIENAGGKITDQNGDPFSYSAQNFNYGYFVASNGKVHDELLSLIPENQ